MHLNRPLLLTVILAVGGAAASAQTVYRCGNSYGSKPCTGGTALDVSDPHTAADAARASKVSAEEWKRAEAMEKSRLAQEKNAPKALVIGPREPPPKLEPKDHAKPDKKHRKAQPQDPEVFTAKAPAAKK
jgi:hypothetical protein